MPGAAAQRARTAATRGAAGAAAGRSGAAGRGVAGRGARIAEPGRVYYEGVKAPGLQPRGFKTPMDDPLLLQTRRHFFKDCAVGLGSMALASLLNGGKLAAAPQLASPLAPRRPHFPGRA